VNCPSDMLKETNMETEVL